MALWSHQNMPACVHSINSTHSFFTESESPAMMIWSSFKSPPRLHFPGMRHSNKPPHTGQQFGESLLVMGLCAHARVQQVNRLHTMLLSKPEMPRLLNCAENWGQTIYLVLPCMKETPPARNGIQRSPARQLTISTNVTLNMLCGAAWRSDVAGARDVVPEQLSRAVKSLLSPFVKSVLVSVRA